MILNHHLFYNIGLGCLFLLLQGIFLPKKVFKLIFTTMILKMYLFMALSFITCKRPPIPNIWVYSSSCFFFPPAVSFMLLCIFFNIVWITDLFHSTGSVFAPQNPFFFHWSEIAFLWKQVRNSIHWTGFKRLSSALTV